MKAFCETLENFSTDINPQELEQLFETYKSPNSLRFRFQEKLCKIFIDFVDGDFCIFFDHLMKQDQMIELKGSELLEAWIISSIKAKFQVEGSREKIGNKLQKAFVENKTVQSCVEELKKEELKSERLFAQWRKPQQQKLRSFQDEIKNHQLYHQIIGSFRHNGKDMHKGEEKSLEQIQQRGELNLNQGEKQEQQNQFALLQLNKKGKLILQEYRELESNNELLETQIQKNILHYFTKIYYFNKNYDPQFYEQLLDSQPGELLSLQSLEKQLKRQQRYSQLIKNDLEALSLSQQNLLNELQSFKNTYQINLSLPFFKDRTTKLLISKNALDKIQQCYDQFFMLWCSLKNDLNILNIFFLNYLIKQANISAKCIEDKHILLLIGPSGAGKTTIMLRLLDYFLEKTKINDLATLTPNVPLKKLHSELITNPGANSTTKFIFSAQINKKYLEKINSENEKRQQPLVLQLHLCDTPGFFDTAGAAVDIANGIGMINAIKRAKSVKPIIVVSAKMVGEKFEGIKELGKIISELFENYQREPEGNCTAFIFNKFQSQEEYSRLQPGILNILNNLSSNEQSDAKYVKFLQVLHTCIKKNKQILRFDPFKIDIGNFLTQLSRDFIQNPQDTFRYSFSSSSISTLKIYFQNKIAVINNLLSLNTTHSYYHLMQMKKMIELIKDIDFSNDYKEIIKKICDCNQECFRRIKLIHQNVLNNEATLAEIKEAKENQDKIRSYNVFKQIEEISIFQEEDVKNLVAKTSTQLMNNLQDLQLLNRNQTLYLKTLKMIKLFGENINPNLLIEVKSYLKKKYFLFQQEMTCFAQEDNFQDYQYSNEMYQNICNCYEMFKEENQVIIKGNEIIKKKYDQIKMRTIDCLQQMKATFFQLDSKKDFNSCFQELNNCYGLFDKIQNANIYPLLRQQNYKSIIIQDIKKLIINVRQKILNFINSKELGPQKINNIQGLMDRMKKISHFKKLSNKAEEALAEIESIIENILNKQQANIKKITKMFTQNRDFSSKIANLDQTIFNLINYSKFRDFTFKNQRNEELDEFITDFGKAIESIAERIKQLKISIKGKIKDEELSWLIKKIAQTKYLKSVKSSLVLSKLPNYQSLIQQFEYNCKQKSIIPFKEIVQDFKSLLSQKFINELSIFIVYKQYLKSKLEPQYYHLNSEIQKEYKDNLELFIQKFQEELQELLDLIDKNEGKMYQMTDDIQIIFKKFDLLNFSLNNQNIYKELGNQVVQNLEMLSKRFLSIFSNSQRLLYNLLSKIQSNQNCEHSIQQIQQYAINMKNFDIYLDEEDSFAEILRLIGIQYEKRMAHTTNRLLYIFTPQTINYEALKELYVKNQKNDKIIQEIMEKVKQFDSKYFEKIEKFRLAQDDVLFENDDFNYTNCIISAFKFRNSISEILQSNMKSYPFKLNDEYFISCVKIMKQKFETICQKQLEIAYKFNLDAFYMKNRRIFLGNLETLVKSFYSSYYNEAKNRIISAGLNPNFKIEWPQFDNCTITDRIFRVHQIIKQQMKKDKISKIIDVFDQSSKKYYQQLDENQKLDYNSQITSKVQDQLNLYQSVCRTDGNRKDHKNKLSDLLKVFPDSQLANQFNDKINDIERNIQEECSNILNDFKESYKSKEYNIETLIILFNKMDRNHQSKCSKKLKDAIKESISSIREGDYSIQQKITKYQKMISKYQNQAKQFMQNHQEYSEIFQNQKKIFFQQMTISVTKIIIQQKDTIFKGELNSKIVQQLIQQNQISFSYYALALEESLQHRQDPSNLFYWLECQIFNLVSVIRYQNPEETRLKQKLYDLSIQIIGAYFRNIEFLSQIYNSLNNKINQIKNAIFRFSKSEKVKNIVKIFDQKEKQIGPKITSQILKLYMDVKNFTFDQQKMLGSRTFDKKQECNYSLDILKKKILFLNNFQTLRNQLMKQGIVLEDFQNKSSCMFVKEMLSLQIQKVKQQFNNLFKNAKNNEISQKFQLMCLFCNLWEKESQNSFKFIKDFGYLLFEFFKDMINTLKGMISSNEPYVIDQDPTNPTRLRRLPASQLLNNKAQQQEIVKSLLSALIVMKKLQDNIDYYRSFIQDKLRSFLEKLKFSMHLNQLIGQIRKNLHIPQVRHLIKQFQIFSFIQQQTFYEETQKNAQEYISQLVFLNLSQRSYLSYQYELFQEQFINFQKEYDEDQRSNKVRFHAKKITKLKDRPIGTILGSIFAFYLELKKNKSNSIECIFKPRSSQIFAIILLLKRQDNSEEFRNAFVEILTGEGKSVVLIGAACYLAIHGYKVYITCYSKYLIQKDSKEFQGLIDELFPEKLIQYGVFSEVCKKIVNKSGKLTFEQYVKKVMNQENLLNKIKNFFVSSPTKSKDILLIDEVDVLFSKIFQGNLYRPTISLTDQNGNTHIKNMLQYIYNNASKSILTLQKIKSTKQYKGLIQNFSNLEGIINTQIKIMLDDVLDTKTIIKFAKRKIILQEGNNSQYQGYQKIFAYFLKRDKEGLRQAQLQKRMKIYFPIAQYSYSQLPKQFTNIFGVTGTLSCLSESNKAKFRSEYKVQKILQLPSIYKKKICKIKDMFLFDNIQNLFDFILQKIKFFFYPTSDKKALIIFFKDKETIGKFTNCKKFGEISCPSIIYLNEKYNNQNICDINQKIERVTCPGRLTISTAQYTRGIDYRDTQLSHGLDVIQAYLPQCIQDYYQTKGRTARAGRQGSYSLLAYSEHIPKTSMEIDESYLISLFNNQILGSEEKQKIANAKIRHEKTLSAYKNRQVLELIEQINPYQEKKNIFFVFGVQGSLQNIQQLFEKISKILETIHSMLSQYHVNLRYQIVFYGNYISLANIQTQMHKLLIESDMFYNPQKLKKWISQIKFRMFKKNKTRHEGESMELFLRHVKRLSQKETVHSIYIFTNAAILTWDEFVKTQDYKRIRQRWNFTKYEQMYKVTKSANKYIQQIKNNNININFAFLGPETDRDHQISPYWLKWTSKENFLDLKNNNLQLNEEKIQNLMQLDVLNICRNGHMKK